MCQGKDKLDYYMKDYKKRSDSLSKKGTGCYEGHEDRPGDVRERF